MATDDEDFTIATEILSISRYPVDHPDRRHSVITLERRPGDRWVVTRLRQYCDAEGHWSYGPDTTDEWRAAHWHAYNDAVRLAAATCREESREDSDKLLREGWTTYNRYPQRR